MTLRWQSYVWLLTTLLALAGAAIAQPPPSPDADDNAPPSPFQFNLPGLGGGPAEGKQLFLAARFEIEKGTRQGRLSVTATPAEGWHTYSMTQPPKGPMPSTLTVSKSKEYKVLGPFTADHAPDAHPSAEFFEDPAKRQKPIIVEEHHDSVTWTAPIELAENADPEQLQISVQYSGQVCTKGTCVPVDENLKAKFKKYYEVAQPTGEFTADSKHVTWTARVEPQVASPGGKVKLIITGTPVEPYHLYAYEVQNDKEGYMPTLIALRPLPAGWKQSAATTDAPILKRAAAVPSLSELHYHKGPVTWTIDIDVPKEAEPGQVELSGLIGFQTCTDDGCDFGSAAKFSVALPVGAATRAQPVVAFEPAAYKEAEELAKAGAGAVTVPVKAIPYSFVELVTAAGLGLLGGLILNVMPCVLPVIPLKLLSFVELAGQSRAKLMSYNFVYALGTISVFLILAVVGIIFNLSWGEQFSIPEFQIIVTLFLFAMVLSLLGVWEIPLPGAIGSGEVIGNEKSGSLASAFVKGFMTTIYATPCSGPFLGIALGATFSFPAYAKILVFLAAGLGFASPYLVFGMLMSQFPGMTRFIPKPGVWMEHVKQGLGFLMMAILVWWYFPIIRPEYHLATLMSAIGIGLGCWLVGKVPPYAEINTKFKAWAGAIAAIAVIAWGSFTFMGPVVDLYAWKPYSEATLAEARRQGKTVMLDFTAIWCANCHVNYKFAINVPQVKEIVEKNNVVAIKADWSNHEEHIKRKLEELKIDGIPLLVVYPADGSKPIIMPALVSQNQVVEALEKAGPSKEPDAGQATAMARREMK
jgi:thiol:disulfide interchange protein